MSPCPRVEYKKHMGTGMVSPHFIFLNTAINKFNAGMFGAYGHGHISDMVESYFVFIDATRGDVLWQHGIYTQGEPIEPSEKFLENVLKFFPARNEPFDQKACAKGKDGFVYCK